MERTLVIIKPDGIERRLIGKIIQRFEDKGFTIADLKMAKMTEALVNEHYAHLTERNFFPDLVNYMTSGPVIYMILEGDEVIALVRKLIGKTKAIDADAGTIRGDFAYPGTANVIHASDSSEAAEIEIKRFFS